MQQESGVRGQRSVRGGDPLLINICIPSLSLIAIMPDAGQIKNLLESAVTQNTKLAVFIKALNERFGGINMSLIFWLGQKLQPQAAGPCDG